MRGMKATMLVAAALVAALCIIPVAGVDGETTISDRGYDLDDLNGGKIWFDLFNDTKAFEAEITVAEDSKVLYNGTQTIAYGEQRITIELPNLKSAGNHDLVVTMEPADQFRFAEFNMTVTVDENILSNWTTYVVVIVAIIAIAVIVYLKMRDAPKKENTMTFEELEAQRKAAMAEKGSRKEAKKAVTTERKRYSGKKD